MEFLNTRYLKLPVWAWILILGVAFGAIYRYRQSKAAATDTTTTDTTAVDPNAITDPTVSNYDASGLGGFVGMGGNAGYAGNTSGGGVADGGGASNTNPDLIDLIKEQNQTIVDWAGTVIDRQGQAGIQCGPGTVWDEASQKCKPIPVVNPGTSSTVPPGTTTSHPSTPAKVTPPPVKATPKCPNGQRFDYLRGTCTKCAGGSTYDAKLKKCRPMTHAEDVHALSIQRNS